MPELRKRPAPPPQPAAPPKKAKGSTTTTAAAKKDKSLLKKAKAAVEDVKDTIVAPVTHPEPGSATESTAERTGEAGALPETTDMASSDAANGTTTTTAPAAAKEPPTSPKKDQAEPAAEQLENPPAHGSSAVSSSASTGGTASTPLDASSVGKKIDLSAFAAEIETHDGKKCSLKSLLEDLPQNSGLVIFTYPKASTPGCTTQACSFRDNHTALTTHAQHPLHIYGLSTDSPKANTTFATKQNLPYPLLCDPNASLTGPLGMKKSGNQKGTLRGVVVVARDGTVKVWFQGGPEKTVQAVKDYVAAAAAAL